MAELVSLVVKGGHVTIGCEGVGARVASELSVGGLNRKRVVPTPADPLIAIRALHVVLAKHPCRSTKTEHVLASPGTV